MPIRPLLICVCLLAYAIPPAVAQKPRLVLNTGGPTAPVRAFGFSPDSRRLYSAGFDKTVQVWDVRQNARGHDIVIAYGDLAHWSPTLSGRRLASLVDPLKRRLGDVLGSSNAPTQGGCDLGLDLGQDPEDARRVFIIWDEAVRQRLALESVERAHPCWQFRERLGASSVYEWQASPLSP